MNIKKISPVEVRFFEAEADEGIFRRDTEGHWQRYRPSQDNWFPWFDTEELEQYYQKAQKEVNAVRKSKKK